MSKLDELIQELCPNGVKYRTLGEVSNITDGFPFSAIRLLEFLTFSMEL